ncbi:MAG: T9SS type A sorting domain-containing protein [Saprospiraceae bacterium]|jgi:hypothetical protein|nr:T9SS type A sorting domain-containing protein [Saprospiraceae bacterium]
MKKNIQLLVLFLCLSMGLSAQRIDDGCSGCNSGNNGAYFDAKKANAEIGVYPNPTAEYIFLTNDDVADQITVFSMVGRKVKVFSVNKGEKYYLGDLPTGTYLVQIADKQRNTLNTIRVTKK